MKKLLFLLIFVIGCTSFQKMQELEDQAVVSILQNLNHIEKELNQLEDVVLYSHPIIKKSMIHYHLENIKKYYNEVGTGLWYIGIIPRKKLGFDIDEVESYIKMRLYNLGIKNINL